MSVSIINLVAFTELRTPNCGLLCYQSPFQVMVILDPAVVIQPLSGLTNPPKLAALLKIFLNPIILSSFFCILLLVEFVVLL